MLQLPQHLPELIVQFTRKMPQHRFLRRNQFLRQLASLLGQRFNLRKNIRFARIKYKLVKTITSSAASEKIKLSLPLDRKSS